MQTADFDHSLFEQGNSEGDKNLLVKFFNKPRPDKEKSLTEGRPIFKEVCYVDICVAGSRTGRICRPATLRDKSRFPRHYEAFINRQEMPIEGTPLVEWPLLTRSQAEEFAFLNVKTVEQLATMPDSNAGKFMGGNALKQKAKDWLEKAADSADELRFKELADKTQAENDELKETMALMTERLNALENAAQVETTEDSATAPSRRKKRT